MPNGQEHQMFSGQDVEVGSKQEHDKPKTGFSSTDVPTQTDAPAEQLQSTAEPAPKVTKVKAKRSSKQQEAPATAITLADKSKTAEQALKAATAQVVAAFKNGWRAGWQTAASLAKFRVAYSAVYGFDRAGDQNVATALEKATGIHLTAARVGQILNTWEFWVGENVDQSIDFKCYEIARKADPKQHAKAELLAIIEEYRVANLVQAQFPRKKKKQTRRETPRKQLEPEQRELVFAAMATQQDDGSWTALAAMEMYPEGENKATNLEAYDWLPVAISAIKELVDQKAEKLEQKVRAIDEAPSVPADKIDDIPT
jgi:hypothetical protein